jgi:hypothetical protein
MNVLGRSASLVALVALIATPAVTSTRFFCRYTGEEITGCAEERTPRDAEVRANECCDQRTFRAIERVRPVEQQQQQAPTPLVIDVPPVLLARVLSVTAAAVRSTAGPSAGPPAFLSHRALLI